MDGIITKTLNHQSRFLSCNLSGKPSWFINLGSISKVNFRRSPLEVFLGKSVLKICRKFTEEHPCQSVISIKLQSDFIEVTLRHRCSPVNLLHIFTTILPKNASGGLLLKFLLDSGDCKICNRSLFQYSRTASLTSK